MLGFLFGTVCLIGLVRVLRGRGFGFRGRFRGGHLGPRGMLRGVFERLDTSPAQEKVMTEAARELFDAALPLRDELRSTRREIAKAMRGPSLDEVAMGELFARHDDVLRDVRKRFVGSLARVHDVLDARQRDALAEALEGGFGRALGGRALGPYRGGVSL
jgi:hypothetical protein